MKYFPTLTDEQRDKLAESFILAVKDITGCSRQVISVAFEPVEPELWIKTVYQGEILQRNDLTHTFPDYPATSE